MRIHVSAAAAAALLLPACSILEPVAERTAGYVAKAADEYCAAPYSVRSEIAAAVNAKTRIATLRVVCDESDTPQDVTP